MAEKSTRFCGLNFRLGVSSLDVDALRADGSLIDPARYEPQVLSFADLYAKLGRRAVRYFRRAYRGPTPARGDRAFNHFQGNEARDGRGNVGNAGHSAANEHAAGAQRGGGGRGGGGGRR